MARLPVAVALLGLLLVARAAGESAARMRGAFALLRCCCARRVRQPIQQLVAPPLPLSGAAPRRLLDVHVHKTEQTHVQDLMAHAIDSAVRRAAPRALAQLDAAAPSAAHEPRSLPADPASSTAEQTVQPSSTDAGRVRRQLLQGDHAASIMHAQAATADAIHAAAHGGAEAFNTIRAGLLGSTASYAAGQNDQRLLDTVGRLDARRLLGVANCVRAQAATADAIHAAAHGGAEASDTARAGLIASTLGSAAAQNDQRLFDTVERMVRP